PTTITTFGSPAAAETDGTIMPRVATKARARANADLRKLDSESRRGGDVPRQTRRAARPAQSRDGPETASPFGSPAVGPGRTCGVRVSPLRRAFAQAGPRAAGWRRHARTGSDAHPGSP